MSTKRQLIAVRTMPDSAREQWHQYFIVVFSKSTRPKSLNPFRTAIELTELAITQSITDVCVGVPQLNMSTSPLDWADRQLIVEFLKIIVAI
jgi:hypothetical protein